MGNDVEGIIVGNKWTQVQACDILDTIFITYARSQFLISTDFVAQVFYLFQELWMTLSECFTTLLRTRIENGAIREDDAGTNHHAVTIGMHTAVHARSIIHDDTTHHCTANGGWVRWKHTSMGFQYLIDTSPYDTWLQGDALVVIGKAVLLPMLSSHDEHRVRTTLSTQRGACSTEGEG